MTKLDRAISIASWIIVFALFFFAVFIWFNAPSGKGPIAGSLGILGGQVFYTVLYTSEALALAYAKATKNNKMRKTVLLVIYLTGFFTAVLSMTIIGWSLNLLGKIILSLLAAACWLYWKMRTEYVSRDELLSQPEELATLLEARHIRETKLHPKN